MTIDYAEMARQHRRTHRPAEYAAIMADPNLGELYFQTLGDQIAARIERVEAQLTATQTLPPGQARAVAEELVLHELLLVVDEETDAATDTDGAYVGWEPGTEPLLDDSTRILR